MATRHGGDERLSITPDRRLSRAAANVLLAAFVLGAAGAARAQSFSQGVAYLVGSQAGDGGWQSGEVRRVHASAEVLRALGELNEGVAARAAVLDFLATAPVEDSDDRARRIAALAAEGVAVDTLLAQLLDDAHPDGGWGLTPSFAADPLDTALAAAALASQASVGNDVLLPTLGALVADQQADGGWPCVDGAEEGDVFCTSEALLALAAYRGRFLLNDQIEAAVDFLRGQLNPDGSVGTDGPSLVIQTAIASMALAAVGAFGREVATVTAFLAARQEPDGSWEGDPYTTALALRSSFLLSQVPYCGDGAANTPMEACDGSVPGGVTCESLGLGPGGLACSPLCTFDTSGCSAAPICGDDVRNQPFEVCDGSDLAAQTCESRGFTAGTLACAADCASFDVSLCAVAPSCGDGVVNQASELCDINDLRGATCQSLGLGGGLLACATDCNLDTSQCDAASFTIDNKGREFITGLMPNPLGSVTASVQLTSDVATAVTIQYPVQSPSFSQTVNLTPGQVTIVNLPSGTHLGWSAGLVRNNAVRLSAPDEFVAYAVNRATFTSDAAMVLPVDALGTSYIVATYQGSRAHSGDRSQFLVIATFDGTHVTITPSQSVFIPAPGTNAAPGVPFQVTLDRGQGFRAQAVFSNGDLTGTVIEADRPVALLNGNLCTNVPGTTTACDHVFEVAHPVRSWGTSALVANLPGRPGGSVYRILASVDGTEVSRDGVLQAALDRGQFLEVGPLAGNHEFTANNPIFVTQFMTGNSSPGAVLGDPAMVNVIPPDQYLDAYTFATVGGSQFVNHFLTIVAPSDSLAELLLDGSPVPAASFSAIGATGYSAAVLPLSEGSHTTSSPAPHGITVEGVNNFDSYIYPGGARLAFINQFCGDGSANLDPEECDGSDFRGDSCASFGFASGFLLCTPECRIETSNCSGFSNEDGDGDGYPATEDCDDQDPEVNPGMQEILGNGVDDDCNPATPDVFPPTALSCRLLTDRLIYGAADVVALEGTVQNDDDAFSLPGLVAQLVILDSGGGAIFDESRQLAPLPPGGRAQQNFVFSAAGRAAGSYQANLAVGAGGETLTECSATFAIDSSASSGVGLDGTLTLSPALVDAGDDSDASYEVHNLGNATLTDLAIRVLLLDPVTGAIVGELDHTTTLDAGSVFAATNPFSTAGLETNKTYLAVLLAKPSDSDTELTLDSATLTVVNAPPDCSRASAAPQSLWPPNHKYVAVAIDGVTDPDGDPVAVSVTAVYQDERTQDLGSGDTCPDADAIGGEEAMLRAERSGRQDGRVYHVFFRAADDRGASCEGEVTVCVPRDHGAGEACVDQGVLFDSTRCE